MAKSAGGGGRGAGGGVGGVTYRKETSWGAHTVTPGFGKNAGKFIAESRGWGGKRGYFRVFDTARAAREYVNSQTRPRISKEAPITF